MRWTHALDRIERADPARLRLGIGLVVTVALLGLITHGHYAGSGDPVHYMVTARSIAFDRDFDVANDYADPSNIIQAAHGDHARIGRNGVLRPVHDVGLPILAAPAFAVAYLIAENTSHLPAWLRRRAKLTEFIALRQLVSAQMILVTAVLGALFFEVSRQLTGEKAWACLWAMAWAVSPPILSHGYVFFTEVPSALVALIVYARRDALCGDAPARAGLALGLLTGALMIIHVRNIGLVLALAAVMLSRVTTEPRRGIGFVSGLAAMAVVRTALNLWFWGTLVTTPHERPGEWPGVSSLLSEAAIRSLGLLFDARHGLLFTAPVYLLVPSAWLIARRRSRRSAYELLALPLGYLLFVVMPVTNVYGWRGGWSPPARFLVPIVPFLALPIPLLLRRPETRAWAAPLLALQLALDAFLWAHPMLLWSEGPGTAPFLERLAGSWLAARVPPWETLTPSILAAAGLVVAGWAVFTRRLARSAPRQRRPVRD
jgi:hypothetical protein